MDADDSESSSEESSGSSSDSDSEYEDTAELLRELEKIKAERYISEFNDRAAEEERRKREEAEAAALQVDESVLSANPLVADDTEADSFTIKKRYRFE